LGAERCRIEVISSTVAGWNSDSTSWTCRSSMFGDVDEAVEARMPSILEVKYWA
jgi:hypothetical protein